jgi:hypothetical protein
MIVYVCDILMDPRVKEVHPLDEWKLELVFSNGETCFYDCRPLLDFGVFQELTNREYFRQVKAEHGTVVWPQEQDICPDILYEEPCKLN